MAKTSYYSRLGSWLDGKFLHFDRVSDVSLCIWRLGMASAKPEKVDFTYFLVYCSNLVTIHKFGSVLSKVCWIHVLIFILPNPLK